MFCELNSTSTVLLQRMVLASNKPRNLICLQTNSNCTTPAQFNCYVFDGDIHSCYKTVVVILANSTGLVLIDLSLYIYIYIYIQSAEAKSRLILKLLLFVGLVQFLKKKRDKSKIS